MRSLSLALLLLVPLACGDDKDPASTKTSGSSESGEGSDSASSGPDSAATEVSGATEASQGTEEPGTSENSVTTPPGTDATSTSPTPETTSETGETVTSAPTTVDPTGDPTTMTTMTTDPGDPDEGATQLCVDTINMYRATLGLAPLQRWADAEDCSDAECVSDGNSGIPHGAFGMCGEGAQNECPGWPGPPEDMITNCLAQMWAEGPGDDFQKHGHYINMSNPNYSRVACGFAEVNGEIWAVQNFQ